MDYDSAMKEVLMHNPNGGALTDTRACVHTLTNIHIRMYTHMYP